MDMDNFIIRMQESAQKAVSVYNELIERSDELPKGVFTVKPSGRLTTAFRFKPETCSSSDFDTISISTPLDAHGALETALFKGDMIVGCEKLEYCQIKRFGSVDELIKELNFLSTINSH